MDTSKLCFGCFSEHDGVGPCPHCGFDLSKAKHPFVALPIGTILNGRYLTGRVLGVGGFGVTYLAFDMTLEISVAVKEYLPSGIALRDADHYSMTVTAPQEQPKFDTGASKFLEEARLLAKLRDVPNIVTVHDYFRENNTAYFVMEYIEGVDLMTYTQQKGGKLSFDEALRILLPIIESLAHVHRHNLLHRDISPDNIVVMKNGSTRLLDFGAARLAIDSEKSKSIILKHGFAPEEQYRKHGNQGPWSDEYALAATMYLIITGVMPPDAIERVHEDTLVPPLQLGINMPQYANDALMKALAVSASGRFPDMNSFAAALSGASVTEAVEMVGGKTVMIDEETANAVPASPSQAPVVSSQQPVVSSQQQPQPVVSAQQPQYTPQKVLSPSVLAGEMQPAIQQQVSPVTKPSTPKKSIWKRPLTYIIAGIIALAGIGTAVGVYISKNYEWGEQTRKTTTKKTKVTTTEETKETEESTIPDPSTRNEGDLIVYTDDVRHFSISADKDFAFENKNGLIVFWFLHLLAFYSMASAVMFTLGAEALRYLRMILSRKGDLVLIYGINENRVDSLTDFVAQSDETVLAYLKDTLGLSDVEMTTDYFFVHSFNGNGVVELSAVAYDNGHRLDVTILATERKEDKGVFLTCGFMPSDEYGMYSSDDLETISQVLLSVAEISDKTSDYVLFEEENKPSFLYQTSEIASITDNTIGNNIAAEMLELKDIGDEESRIMILSLGSQDSITTACTTTEQALGSMYKFGGYESVTPTINTNLEMRIRNYTITRIDGDGKSLECTACVINLNGTYYSVVAICGDEAARERVALDYSLVIKSMIRS